MGPKREPNRVPTKEEKMAIKKSEFINKIDTGLKADKSYTRFYFRCRQDGKDHTKIFDYTDKQWDKRTRISKAKEDAINERKIFKQNLSKIGMEFNDSSNLNTIADAYFEKVCDDSRWTQEKKDAYKLYIRNGIGKKKIKDIRLHDINTLRLSMQKKGHSKQTENGCSVRTIKKVLIQILKPIFQYAYDNKIINDIPKIELSKSYKKSHKTKKKRVTDAREKLIKLFKVITTLYENDPFYRALFLFAFYGRRWGEIKTLRWSDINFSKNFYKIRAENNKIGEEQFYELPIYIKDALLQIKENNNSLIFKSPITGKTLTTPKRQLAKIKTVADIPELTMHYFRHILVSAMGEAGIASTILSASLGHTDLDTVHKFYLSANHKQASKIANQTIEKITHQDLEDFTNN